MTDHLSPEQLSAFVDGEAASQDVAAVTAHLTTCADCRIQHEALLAVEQALVQLRPPETAPDLLWDLRRRIALPPARRWGWTWAVAGALLLAVLLTVWPKPRGGSPPPVRTTPIPRPATDVVRVKRIAPSSPVQFVEAGPSAGQRPRPYRRAPLARRPVTPPAQTLVAQGVRAPEVKPPVAVAARTPDGQGIILILGEPQPVLPSSHCYLKVSQPDGSTSEFTQTQSRDATGQLQSARISYRTTVATLP